MELHAKEESTGSESIDSWRRSKWCGLRWKGLGGNQRRRRLSEKPIDDSADQGIL